MILPIIVSNILMVSSLRSGLASYTPCTLEVLAHSRCVGDYMGEVRKDQCTKEFKVFMTCIRQSANAMGTKL